MSTTEPEQQSADQPEYMYSVTIQLAFDGHDGTYPLTIPFAEHNDARALAFAKSLVENEWDREALKDIRRVQIARYVGNFFPEVIFSAQAEVFAPKVEQSRHLV